MRPERSQQNANVLVPRHRLSNFYLWTMDLRCKLFFACADPQQHSSQPAEAGDEETVRSMPRGRQQQGIVAAIGRSRRAAADTLRPGLAPRQRCEAGAAGENRETGSE